MAYYDHGAALHDKECKEQYEELKASIRPKFSKKARKWDLAYKHILKLEIETVELKKKIEEYEEFFQQLQKLTPREPSMHDTFG